MGEVMNKKKKHGQFLDIVKRFLNNKSAVVGLAIFMVIVLLAVFAGAFGTYEECIETNIMEKNKVRAADPAEIISPGKTGKFFYVGELYDTQGRIKANIPHPQMTFWARVPFEVTPGDIMRVGTKRES